MEIYDYGFIYFYLEGAELLRREENVLSHQLLIMPLGNQNIVKVITWNLPDCLKRNLSNWKADDESLLIT